MKPTSAKVQLRRFYAAENQPHLDGVVPIPRVTGELRAEVTGEFDAKFLVATAIMLYARSMKMDNEVLGILGGASIDVVSDLVAGNVEEYALDDLVRLARNIGTVVQITDMRYKNGVGA